jgi:ribonucleoside-triphosphate reductase
MDMHIKKFPALKKEIGVAYQFVFDKKVLPSMRSMQFGGKPIEVNPARRIQLRLYACKRMGILS